MQTEQCAAQTKCFELIKASFDGDQETQAYLEALSQEFYDIEEIVELTGISVPKIYEIRRKLKKYTRRLFGVTNFADFKRKSETSENEPNQNRPVENIVEGLSQHARFLTKEERKAELRDRGIDVDGFLNEAHSIIAHHQKEKRLAWMKVANEKSQRFAGEESSLVSWVGKGKDEILAAFQNLLNTATSKTLRGISQQNRSHS